jgi:DNA end-binding protein Ku
MREKQYLAAIRPYGKGLAMSTMLFADEVVPQSAVDGIPARRPSVGTREKHMAVQIIDSLTREWDAERYHDDYEEQVRALIKAKAKGKTVETPEREEPGKVLDLMEALRASLEHGGREAPKRKRTTKKAGSTRARTGRSGTARSKTATRTSGRRNARHATSRSA